jgi:hypothetical protein
VKRSHLASLLLLVALAGGWGVHAIATSAAHSRTGAAGVERTTQMDAAPARVESAFERAAALVDARRDPPAPSPAVEPPARARIEPLPGPASIVGRIRAADVELSGLIPLDDVQLDWRVPSSRRWQPFVEPDGRTVELETWDGDRYITFADADGAFEYTNAQVGVALELCIDGFGLQQTLAIAPLAAGERRQLDVVIDGVTLAGAVTDADGRPVPDVSVFAATQALLQTADGRTRDTASCRTDDQGRFVLLRLARSRWSLGVPGYELAAAERIAVDTTHGSVLDIDLVLRREITLSGTVTWSDGTRADLDWIEVQPRSGGRLSTRRGEFQLENAGTDPLRIEARARRPGEEGIAIEEGVLAGGAPLRLVLQSVPLHAVRGRVKDGRGAPVVACGVQAEQGGRAPTGSLSDREGWFDLAVPEGVWTLTFRADGFTIDKRTVTVPSPAATTLHVELERAGAVRGRVVDADGLPVGGARIWGGVADGESGADGTWLVHVGDERALLSASKAGYADSESVEVSASPDEPVDGVVLRLAPGCILAGRVLESDGTPAQRVEVSTARWLTETDERGEFWMHDEPSGRVLVHATDLATGRRASCAVELAPGRLAELELRLPQLDTVRIRGRITRGGRPAAGSIALRSDAMKLEAETDEGGGFSCARRLPEPRSCGCGRTIPSAPAASTSSCRAAGSRSSCSSWTGCRGSIRWTSSTGERPGCARDPAGGARMAAAMDGPGYDRGPGRSSRPVWSLDKGSVHAHRVVPARSAAARRSLPDATARASAGHADRRGRRGRGCGNPL